MLIFFNIYKQLPAYIQLISIFLNSLSAFVQNSFKNNKIFFILIRKRKNGCSFQNNRYKLKTLIRSLFFRYQPGNWVILGLRFISRNGIGITNNLWFAGTSQMML